MSKLIKDATLLGIADAIRGKTQTSDPIKVKDFASVIANMETGATEGMFCWAKYSADQLILPVGYTEVSYLQASANCAINTGVIPNGNTRLKIKFNASGNGAPFGSEKGFLNTAYAAIRSSTSYYCYQGQSYSPTINTGVDYEVDFNGPNLTINGSLVKTFTAATIDTTYPLYLFVSNRAGATPEPFNGKIYSRVEIYKDGVNLSRYFIACKDTDGNYGMYDVVNKEMLYNIGSGTFAAGEEFEGVKPIGYILSDNLNAYPQDGFHTDGYYYKLLENDIVWDERGQYAWSKYPGEPREYYDDFETSGYNQSASSDSVVFTPTNAGWTGGYAQRKLPDLSEHIVISAEISTVASPVDDRIIGFSQTGVITSDRRSSILYGIYLYNGTIYRYLNGSSTKLSATYDTSGKTVSVVYEDGVFTMLVDTQVIETYTYTPSALYAVLMQADTKAMTVQLYEENEDFELIGYVIGNEEDAYPNDGYVEDGYYYVKVGATKVTPKYASGSLNIAATVAGRTVTVTGLDFRPYAVCLVSTSNNYYVGYGICNSDGTVAAAYSKYYNNAAYEAIAFSPSDDGFTIQTSTAIGTSTVAWHAIGY